MRKQGGQLAQELKRIFETLEGVGELRVDQQGIHGPHLQEEVRRVRESAEGATVGSSATRMSAAALRALLRD